jgi:hypothetical protein
MRSWMKLIVPALVTLGGPFANAAGPGHDYTPFVAVEGYQRDEFTEHKFDKAVFVSDDKGKKTTVAGYFFKIQYRLTDPTAGGDTYLLSSLQAQVGAIKGAQILNQTDSCNGWYSDQAALTVRFQKGNTPVWVAFSCGNGNYIVTVVEEQAFHQ